MRTLLPVLLLFSSTCTALAEPRRAHRNPFRAPPPEATPKPRPRDPASLQGYPLTDLRLTAIIRDGDGKLFASVEIPSGVGFKVTEGTIIGDSHSEVIDVSVNGITVKEDLPPQDGTPTIREIPLHPKGPFAQ